MLGRHLALVDGAVASCRVDWHHVMSAGHVNHALGQAEIIHDFVGKVGSHLPKSVTVHDAQSYNLLDETGNSLD